MERQDSHKTTSNIMDRKKLLKQNGTYNLIHLKTHLQDEGVLDISSMQ